MCSRLALSVLSPLIILISACGLKVGEKSIPDKPVVIGGSGFSCLSHISEHLESFVEAKLKSNDIRQFVGCLRYSLESFAKHARGLERNVFTPEEIRDFMHEYFLKSKNRRINDNLLQDFMVIKKTLLGGSVEQITHADLGQAVQFLHFIEEQMLKLNPHMRVYNIQIGRRWAISNRQEVEPEVEVAVRVLREVGEAFGRRLGQANSPYPLAHLESFMREFREFSSWEDIFTNSRSPATWTGFFAAYKSVVAGSNSDQIEVKDWPHIFTSAADLFGITLKTRYASNRKSLMYGEGLVGVIRIARDLHTLGRSAILRQSRNVITYHQLDRLIDSLSPLGLMPRVPSADETVSRTLKPESLKKILRATFDRVLGNINVPWRIRHGEGFNEAVLGEAQIEFNRWAAVQNFLDRTFQSSDKDGTGGQVETLSERLGPIGASRDFMRILGEEREKDEALSLVRMMEQSLRPLFRPGEDQIFLTESSLMPKYQLVHGFHNLSMMNISRAVVGLIGRGYSTFRGPNGLLDGGITDEEMQAFYLDFREFGVDVQLFDPRTDNSGYRSFQEANLFTYTGNGLQRMPSAMPAPRRQPYTTRIPPRKAPADPLVNPVDSMMSYPEGMEYLLFIVSGGAMGRAIYSGMMGANGLCVNESVNAPISVHGYRMVERGCFRENLMRVLLPRLTTMPTMRAELERAPQSEKYRMTEALMDTIYSQKFSDPDYIEWHEINTLAVIVHYTESVMTRYNTNQDIYLDTGEVWQAYKTFRVYMENMVEMRCKQMIEARDNPMSTAAQIEAESKYWSEPKEWMKKMIRGGCGIIPEFVSKAVFAHLVKHGEVPPSLSSINYAPDWWLLGFDFKVDRAGLLKVFAALVKSSSDTARKQPTLRSISGP